MAKTTCPVRGGASSSHVRGGAARHTRIIYGEVHVEEKVNLHDSFDLKMIVLAAPLHLQEDALVFERPLSLVVAVAVSVVGDVPFPKHLLPPVAPPARQICKITSLASANFATAWPVRGGSLFLPRERG